jgi:hypothetical protein
LVSVRIGSYEAATATLGTYGDVLAEPIRAALDSLIAKKSSDQAGSFQERMDNVLAILKTPTHSVSDILSNTDEQACTPPPLPDRWLFDVAQRAEGYLKLIA